MQKSYHFCMSDITMTCMWFLSVLINFLWKLYHFAWVIWLPDWLVVVQLSHAWFNLFPHSETRVREWLHEFPVVCLGLNWLGNQRDMSCTCFPCNKVPLYWPVMDQYIGLWHYHPSITNWHFQNNGRYTMWFTWTSCHKPMYWSAMDQYRDPFLQGK